MQKKYAILIRAKDGTYINRLNDFISFHIIDTLNDVGSWTLESTSQTPCPLEPGMGIVVARDGVYFYSGVLTQIQDTYDAYTGLYTWQVQGAGDLEYIRRRICYVDPATGSTTAYSHYQASGTLATVIQTLINLNLGPSAMATRQEPIVKASSQTSGGPAVSVSLRFQNMLTAIVTLCRANDYAIRAVWDEENCKVSYEVFQGRDLTSAIIFTEQLNNITESEYLASAPGSNYVLAGGTGEMTARSFATAQSNDSISQWGRIEKFYDCRNQGDVDQSAAEELTEQSADVIGYNCTTAETDTTPQYMTDYRLGDYVGMKVHGQFVTAQIQQIEVEVATVPHLG